MHSNNKIIIFCIAFFMLAPAISNEEQSTQIKFQTTKFKNATNKKLAEHINIEEITIKESEQISKATAKQISNSLHGLAGQFYKDAKYCNDSTWNGPWGYDAQLAHIYITRDIMSVVFKISSACSGNIDIDKISKNYSASNGMELSAQYLLEKFSPSLMNRGFSAKNSDVKLDDEAVNILITENKNIISPEIASHCSEYFKRISYSIWIQPSRLILSPLFSHQESICHNDYSFKFR